MEKISIICLICEDIREEKSGGQTLVGLMPSVFNVQEMPFDTRVALYVRANFDPHDMVVHKIMLYAKFDDERFELGEIPTKIIETATSDARQAGLPLAGVATRIQLGQLRFEKTMHFRVFANIDGNEKLIAAMNVQNIAALPQAEVST